MDKKSRVLVNNDLLERAMEVGKQNSKAAIVEKALQDLIEREKTRVRVLEMQGKGWGWDDDELEKS